MTRLAHPSRIMNATWIKKKLRPPNFGDGTPSTQSTTSLPASGRFGRFKSRAAMLFRPWKQPANTTAASTPSAADTTPNDGIIPVTNFRSESVPGEVGLEAAPVIEGDSVKTVAWNAFRETLSVLKEVAGVVPFANFGDAIGGFIAVLDLFEVRAR